MDTIGTGASVIYTCIMIVVAIVHCTSILARQMTLFCIFSTIERARLRFWKTQPILPLVWRENVSFVHVICMLSRVRRFPLQRGLKYIKSMLVSISALAFVCCVEVCVHYRKSISSLHNNLCLAFFFYFRYSLFL